MFSFSLRQMAKNAVAWAVAKGLKRTSPIHGNMEYRVPTDFSFSHRDVQRVTTSASAEAELEDELVELVSCFWQRMEINQYHLI